MPYIKPIQNYANVNFLASAHFQSFTCNVPQAMGVADGRGNLIVAAGTIFPANDATAQGILLNDVDVTTGAGTGALIVEGYILQARLPVVPAEAAITALKEIKFK